MDNKVSSKGISSSDFDKDFTSTDYENLVLRLKNIKESIILLEKEFIEE